MGVAQGRVVEKHDHALIGLGDHAWLLTLCHGRNGRVPLVAVNDLKGHRERVDVGIPLPSATYGGVGDVAEGAVPPPGLAQEVGDLPAQAAVRVVDADQTHEFGHPFRLGAAARARAWKDPAVVAMTRSLEHLAWTNDKLFAELAALPAEALAAQYAPDAWPVGRLAMHIVNGAEWYCYCLAGMPWTDLVLPTGPADLEVLRTRLAELDAVLIAQADLPDELVEFQDEDERGPYARTALRSTILAQACLHAAEHRAQIACALEINGFAGITLDDYDVWAFAEQE